MSKRLFVRAFVGLLILVALACSLPSLPDLVPGVATPTPSPTPQLLPPVVLEHRPATGEEVPPDDAVVLVRFDRPMDRASVEDALRLSPEAEGEVAWPDDRTVEFRPRGLASAARYRVLLGTEARSGEGLTLTQELAFAFSTTGALTVTGVTPADGAADLRGDLPLVLSFNRPLVPVNCTGQPAGGEECAPLPLEFSPPTEGKGAWVSTSAYRFTPDPSWQAGQTYAVRLAAGVTSLVGSTLEAPTSWSFSTAAPRVVSVNPPEGAADVALEMPVEVVFNTPMSRGAVRSALALVSADGTKVRGSFGWGDGDARLVFTPTELLEPGTSYALSLGESARAATGARLGVGAFESVFTTVPLPRVVGFEPASGSRNVSPYGSVRLSFTGALSESVLASHLSIDPRPADPPQTFWVGGEELHVSFPLEPRTRYCVAIETGVTDRYGHPMEGAESCFTTGDLRPLFAPLGDVEVFTFDASRPPVLNVLHRNAGALTFRLEEQDAETFVTRGEDGRALRSFTRSYAGPLNRPEISPLPLTAGETTLPTGFYAVSWPSVDGSAYHVRRRFAVVDTHVTVKVARDEALVWATELRRAEPRTGVEVRLLNDRGDLLGRGVTDGDGVARVSVGVENLWSNVVAVVGGAGASGFGVGASSWNRGAAPWEFDVDFRSGPFLPHTIYLHSDRPIYRPGQTVHARGIVRGVEGDGYALPPSEAGALVSVRDPDWEVIHSQRVPLSELGTFEFAFTLPEEARLGAYAIQASVPGSEGEWSLPFVVAAYRKPEFRVAVTPERDDLLHGEEARALVDASYFFGSPVADAEVAWEVRSLPYYEPISGYGGGGGGGWEEEVVAAGEARTDGEGRFLLELPAELPEPEGGEGPGPHKWTVEATVADEAGLPVTGRGELVVHPARFYLHPRPRQWMVAAGEGVTVEVTALDWEGTPVPDREVELALARRTWYRMEAEEPFAAPRWGYTDTLLSSVAVTTDRGGETAAELVPPRGGAYVLVARSEDDEGNPVRGEADLWVSGPEGVGWQMGEGRVEPVADASSYRPGDEASILVPTPFEGPFQVLMTVERGSVQEARRFVAEEANPVVRLPIRAEHAPGVYVSFVVVKGAEGEEDAPDVRVGLVRLEVEAVEQTLAVEVVPDGRTPYEPGEVAELTVRTLDSAGEPVDAEVALAVVDEAVLTLRAPNAPSLLDAFYGKPVLSVLTGDSLLTLVNRFAEELEELREQVERLAQEMDYGGIGGGGGGGETVDVDLRRDFPGTALWEGQLRTGPSGEVSVSLPLPDSLTTWIVDARAVTAETQVGEAREELVVSRPLFVRPLTPRFFVAGDEAMVGAVVHNESGDDLAVTAALQVEGVVLQGDPTRRVEVPAGGRVHLSWPLKVPVGGEGGALLTFSASGGGYNDTVRPPLAGPGGALLVYRYTSPEVVGSSGVLPASGSRLESVVLPPDVRDDASLALRLEPSLAAGMTEALGYLDTFPYDSTEQIVSRFLSNVLVYRALEELNLDRPALEAELARQVPHALKQLYERQLADGGWGWWSSEESDEQVTAYVALAMVEAERAGFDLWSHVLAQALIYLDGVAEDDLAPPLLRSLAVYALAQERPLNEEVADELFAERDALDVSGRAWLALALSVKDEDDGRIATLMDEVRGMAEVTASGAHWQEADARLWSTDVRATAVALHALVRLTPEDPLIPGATRWLMVARRGDRWTTTQETVWSLLALTEVLSSTGELRAEYGWGVSLNGVALGSGTATGSADPVEVRVGVADPEMGLRRNGANALEVVRGQGPGSLYYSTHLTLFEVVEGVEAASRGFTLHRQYCVPTEDASPDEPCQPPPVLQPGDRVEVRLTLVVPEPRHYVVLEDFFPAGTEALDPTLATEPQGEGGPEVHVEDGWWAPFDHRELRDERAVFFADELAPGTYHVRYRLRATLPGAYRVLPATVSETYFPEVWGRTEGGTMEILSENE